MSSQNHKIAEILCNATEVVLWSQYLRLPDFKQCQLETRIGWGQATYCKRVENRFIITYGQRMVESKRDRSVAKAWLTGREILRQGYFSAELTFLNLMAQTVLHEYAHLLQDLRQGRRRGQVHTPGFYRILTELHADGLGESVRTFIEQRCSQLKISLMFERDSSEATTQRESFVVGDSVCFDYQDREVSGVVRRVNRKSITVYPREGSEQGYWRVSPIQLRRKPR